MVRQFYRWSFVLLVLFSGCAALDGGKPDDDKPPRVYSSLAGHSCAIMVYADLATRTEFSAIQLDLARLLRDKLASRVKPENPDPKNPPPATRFLEPASVVRYQREHPGLEALPIEQVAPRLSVERVVYVEIERFETQSPDSVMLLKGVARASIRILEVADRKATIVLEEVGIRTEFPKNSPAGVLASDKMNLRTIYEGTLESLATRLANRVDKAKDK